MPEVYIALGSNLGNRELSLIEAARRINGWERTEVRKAASVYETEPVGGIDQPKYLNTVLHISTQLSPEALLEAALQTESELGRVRRERWGPRVIDIDLLWYEGEERDTKELTLPHPRLTQRNFVIVPLAELAPETVIEGASVTHWEVQLGTFGMTKLEPLQWQENPRA